MWQCAAGHSFDISSQGYTHLLPVQKKRSHDPGDSKEMVASRRRFLASDAYDPLANATNQMVLLNAPADATISCLDAGCGERSGERGVGKECVRQCRFRWSPDSDKKKGTQKRI